MTDLFAYAAAKRGRDAGMAKAASRDEGFGERAYQALVKIARRQIHVHVDDLLTELTERPASPNAMGAVWMRAIKNGIIQRSNQTKPCTVHKRKHAHRYPVYFSRICDPRCPT